MIVSGRDALNPRAAALYPEAMPAHGGFSPLRYGKGDPGTKNADTRGTINYSAR
jgi:hypothetical protein